MTFALLCRMCSSFQVKPDVQGKRNWMVAYLNPNAISQSAINPKIDPQSTAYKDKTPEEIAGIQEEMLLKARSDVATYLVDCFFRWQDRNYIVAPYNFK